MSIFFNHNGSILPDGAPALAVNNRAFRYGDGIFETMRIVNGSICRASLHFERLFNSLIILRYNAAPNFTAEFLIDEILKLIEVNRQSGNIRIRLTIYRGNGDLYEHDDNHPRFVIQSTLLPEAVGEWQSHGLSCGIYADARKSCDRLSPLKTNNFLPYVMAGKYAEENKLNDAILLNTHGRICDSTVANVFIVNDKKIYTPPLSEGCVAGTFRKFLIRELDKLRIPVIEKPLMVDDLKDADEIFLTNAIRQIQWVSELKDKHYDNSETLKIYSLLNQQFDL